MLPLSHHCRCITYSKGKKTHSFLSDMIVPVGRRNVSCTECHPNWTAILLFYFFFNFFSFLLFVSFFVLGIRIHKYTRLHSTTTVFHFFFVSQLFFCFNFDILFCLVSLKVIYKHISACIFMKNFVGTSFRLHSFFLLNLHFINLILLIIFLFYL